MKRFLTFSCVTLLMLSLLGCSRQTKPTQQEAESQRSSGENATATAPSDDTPGSDAVSDQTTASLIPGEAEDLVFGDQFPKVLAVKAKPLEGDRWMFNVKLSSPYDSPQRYADGWRVLDDQDNELGLRILGHDHASEQPFTRSHAIEVPNDTKLVFVEGRDQANGWSGQRFKVELP